jgi:type I pantothenate kinase
MDIRAPEQQYNPYRVFSREQWARLRDDTPMTLEPGEFERLRSMHDRLDMKEVEEIFLPLSRLLSIYVDATHRLYQAQRQFLGIRDRKVPYIIGVAGSVAVGKSTAIGPLVAAAQGRSCDDRRLSVSERGAGAARSDAEKGLSRKL